jgi:hypothetical protein
MKVNAIIIDGRHGGFIYPNFEYCPTIKLPITQESQISIGEKYDNSIRLKDEIEYKECFRSVDKNCVMYSTNGRWEDIKYAVLAKLDQTYPIRLSKLV